MSLYYMDAIKRWCTDHSLTDECLLIKMLRGKMNEERVMEVLEILDEVCHECWDEESPCSCWNDE